jgi:opacity protein-like surface antigen
MKKIRFKLFTILTIILFSQNVIAQVIELSPFYGWQMNGRMRFYEGDLETDDNPLAGATMSIELGSGYGVELMFSHTKTHSYWYTNSNGYFPGLNFKLTNQYYQIGSYKYLDMDQLQPFTVLSLGASRYHPLEISDHSVNIDDVWRFAMTFGLGIKYFFSDKVGIRLQGAFMMPMYFSGVGFYFGSGGSGLTTYSAVPMLQGNFNGGLIFRFGK